MAIHEGLGVALGSDIADGGILGTFACAKEGAKVSPSCSHGIKAVFFIARGNEHPSVSDERPRIKLQALDVYFVHDVPLPRSYAYMTCVSNSMPGILSAKSYRIRSSASRRISTEVFALP